MKCGQATLLSVLRKSMIINKRNFIDYSFLLMVIAISGIPYFTTTILYIPVVVILLILFLLRRKTFDKQFYLIIILIFIITVLQTYIFGFFSFQTILGVFLRVIIGFLIVKILNKKFTTYYVNLLYYLSIMSTIVFILVVTMPFLAPLLKSTLVPLLNIFNFAGSSHETLIIYNFNQLDGFRNSGPFWEPGAFGGYLIIAIIFIYFSDTIKNKNKKLIVLLLALITTLSTTAYAALGIFLFFYYFKSIKNIFLKIAISISIIYGGYYAFFNVDFIGKKIEHQLSEAKDADAYGADSNTQRFLNILRDIEDFKGHEWVGRGSNPKTRYAYKAEEQIRTVGLTDIIVRMGLPFFLIMLFFVYKSMCSLVNYTRKRKEQLYCIGSVLTILLTLMSEVYFNFPLYWSLIFLFLVYKPKGKIK